jgi:hypothetical protein
MGKKERSVNCAGNKKSRPAVYKDETHAQAARAPRNLDRAALPKGGSLSEWFDE